MLYKSRRLGNFPPPYPNGWYVLAQSGDLKRKEVKPINVLGGQYVLWRGQDGVAHLFDAYCPHLGANMAFGGTVNGNSLKCPFHGWEFGGNGECSSVPYSKPNPHARAGCLKIVEQNQIIYFWYDAEKRDPWWYPPFFEEIESGKFTYHGRTEHQVLAHIQELPENGADVPHLNAVHSSVYFGLTHQWEAGWKVLPFEELRKEDPKKGVNGSDTTPNVDLPHWTEIRLRERVVLFGIPLPFMDIHVVVNQIGPGIVWLRFHTPFGQALVLGAATPFGPMVQRTFHMIFSEKTIPRFAAKYIVYTLGQFYEQDVMIWQWKTYPDKPALDKQDANIKRYRKWFSQFYSEHSVTFDDAVQTYGKGLSALPQNFDW